MITVNRVFDAKKFLQENSEKTMIIVSRIFQFSRSILQSSINREKTATTSSNRKSQNGLNKILENHETQIVHEFIRRLLIYSIPPTKSLIFNSIRNLKLKQNFLFQGFFQRWFQTWWKTHNLHTIKIKSLATVRYTAANAQAIENWFKGYRLMLRKLNIKKKRNIINFDEQGVRIGCMKKQNILMSDDISEFYVLNFENRQSLIIFENINAADDLPPPFMLVIQGQELMKS